MQYDCSSLLVMGRIVMILYMLKMWYMVTFVLKKLFLLWRVQKSVVECMFLSTLWQTLTCATNIMTYLKFLGLLYNQYGANEYVGLSVSASRRTWIQKVHILWICFYTSIESPCYVCKMDTLACSYNKYV